jgi:hypothetical protein
MTYHSSTAGGAGRANTITFEAALAADLRGASTMAYGTTMGRYSGTAQI